MRVTIQFRGRSAACPRGALPNFPKFFRQQVIRAGVVGLWLAGLWLNLVPTFQVQRVEIMGIVATLTAFEIAYVYQLKNCVQGSSVLERSRRAPALSTRSFVIAALWTTPLLMSLTMIPYFAYRARINQSTVVEGGKLLAMQERELSAAAVDYLQRATHTSNRRELVRLSEEYLAPRQNLAWEPTAVREHALEPIAFGADLVLLSALSMTPITLSFAWIATLEYLRLENRARGRTPGYIVQRRKSRHT